MSKQMKYRQNIRTAFGLFILIACVWFFPISTALAASAASGFTVSVRVVDTVAIDSGNTWAQVSPLGENGDTETKLVTRVASPQSHWNVEARSADAPLGLPLGNGSESGFAGDAAWDGIMLLKTSIRL